MEAQCPYCGAQNELVLSTASEQRCRECGVAFPLLDHGSNVVAAEAVEGDGVVVDAIEVEAMPIDQPTAEVVATVAPSSAEKFKGSPEPGTRAGHVGSFDDDEEPPEDLFTGGKNRDDSELDMTPMVDVTFLLLIFFMVTASFSLQKSITMPREQSDAPSTNTTDEEEDEIDLVTVQIDEFNSFTVLAADWEREVPGKQNLIRALKEAKPETEARLKVEVHEDAVIEAVIDAMDAGAEVGFSEIQKSEVKGFD